MGRMGPLSPPWVRGGPRITGDPGTQGSPPLILAQFFALAFYAACFRCAGPPPCTQDAPRLFLPPAQAERAVGSVRRKIPAGAPREKMASRARLVCLSRHVRQEGSSALDQPSTRPTPHAMARGFAPCALPDCGALVPVFPVKAARREAGGDNPASAAPNQEMPTTLPLVSA